MAILSVRLGALRVPAPLNPWATLDVHAPPNLLTRYKLGRLSRDSALCHQVLATTSLRYESLTDRQTGEGCGLYNAVRIDATSAELEQSFSLTCRAAISLALWETHVVQPAARARFGQPVATLEHFGSYSCRNVYGRADATRSQHATAEALDVAGFILTDGRKIRVLGDWDGDATEAAFLRAVRDGACRFFDGVLSPDYNEAHRDHFHLDRGRYRICR
jgi:hypothetical protein